MTLARVFSALQTLRQCGPGPLGMTSSTAHTGSHRATFSGQLAAKPAMFLWHFQSCCTLSQVSLSGNLISVGLVAFARPSGGHLGFRRMGSGCSPTFPENCPRQRSMARVSGECAGIVSLRCAPCCSLYCLLHVFSQLTCRCLLSKTFV